MKDTIYIIHAEALRREMGSDTTLQYDLFRLITAVQGLVNREEPELYLFWQEADPFWLDYMQKEGNFLHGRNRVELCDWSSFIEHYGTFIAEHGLILWDGAVPATANAAMTACGVDGYIPVRGGSEAYRRITAETGAPVVIDLTGKFTGAGTVFGTDRPSSGSAKCDAYLWALETYMDRCHPTILFYTLDGIHWRSSEPYYPDLGNAFVFNMDYAVSRSAFVFDLSSYDDEVPCDDPNQPLGCDFAVMQEILARHYVLADGRMTTVCGFNPWQLKYTTHGSHGMHAPVDAEWHLTEVLSAYNCIKDADAFGYCGLANASVYSHFPLKAHYRNRKPKGYETFDAAKVFDPTKTYVLFYVGDYDAAAWTARFIPQWYRDPALGKLPLMWCFNPNLSDRIPMAYDFVFENFTDNDYFAAGDSGAGYNNPALLYEPRPYSGLPSGVEENIRHNREYFERFDLDIIGFVINGDHPTDERQMRDLARFAPVGSAYNNGPQNTSVVDGAVYMPHSWDIAQQTVQTAAQSAEAAFRGIDRFPPQKRFHIFRTILVSPTQHGEILAEMKRQRPEANFELVDPYTFFALAKYAVEHGLTY